jgi:hypothetical protein
LTKVSDACATFGAPLVLVADSTRPRPTVRSRDLLPPLVVQVSRTRAERPIALGSPVYVVSWDPNDLGGDAVVEPSATRAAVAALLEIAHAASLRRQARRLEHVHVSLQQGGMPVE